MWTTYAALLQELKAAQNAPYLSDPERQEAIFRTMQEIMQTMLEKLSRAADESPGQHPAVHEGCGCVFCDLNLDHGMTTDGTTTEYWHMTRAGKVPCTNPNAH